MSDKPAGHVDSPFPLEGEKVVGIINFRDTVIVATDCRVYEKTDGGFVKVPMVVNDAASVDIAALLDSPEMVEDVADAINPLIEDDLSIPVQPYVRKIAKAALTAIIERLNNGK